jgi:hypothetical protein
VAHDAHHIICVGTNKQDMALAVNRLGQVGGGVVLFSKGKELALVEMPIAGLMSDERVAAFGYAVLLCAHSMPSRGRDGHQDIGRERAEVVPGSRGRTSAAAAVIDAVDSTARAAGFSVAHDQPYRGGFSTGHYGRPEQGVHAVQIELNRRLYMNELSLEKKPREFEILRGFCRDLTRRLSEVSLRSTSGRPELARESVSGAAGRPSSAGD